jgi:quaternary ammonium compound-resistance protein SugE
MNDMALFQDTREARGRGTKGQRDKGTEGQSYKVAKLQGDGEEIVMRVGTAWMVLLVAGVLETGWALGLKFTHGFSRLWPSAGTAAIGMAWLGESRDALRVFCLALIIAGVLGLRFFGASEH